MKELVKQLREVANYSKCQSTYSRLGGTTPWLSSTSGNDVNLWTAGGRGITEGASFLAGAFIYYRNYLSVPDQGPRESIELVGEVDRVGADYEELPHSLPECTQWNSKGDGKNK